MVMEPYEIKSHPYECMTLNCLCPFFKGRLNAKRQCILANGRLLNMAYRKEYRMLTDDERNRWHNVLNILKSSGEYDRLSAQHQEVGSGSGAHSGPEGDTMLSILQQFEIAVRLVDPSLAIPYWDSVIDSYLPDPRDSILFTPLFFGDTDFYGNVVTGPFAYWRCLDGRTAIWRNMGKEGSLFTENSINNVLAQTNIEFVLAYTAPLPSCPVPTNFFALEYAHSNIHLWVGGHMKPPSSSSNDPLFYTHHSFVDYIWEMWRQLRQTRQAREYSRDMPQCADPQHFSYAVMRPFYTLVNRDGLSNAYTDYVYHYAPRPSCTKSNPTCNSTYLFCDIRGRPHCVSKIKIGGRCVGFEGFNSCYKGFCLRGYCVAQTFHSPTSVLEQLDDVALPASKQSFITEVKSKTNFTCYDRHPCCGSWSRRGICNNASKRAYCAVSCSTCNLLTECADRHPSCAIWEKLGECSGRSSHFMAENCRTSCKLCGESKSLKCSAVSSVNFLI
ncbi:unnamed protein product [Enterobius vermicularis]|uniref:Tyrosinase_Cu-bd domain-containing protein n=1 Tax=Enterobius vermicularis TaxID=51028 RepID=A0A0N4VKH8_ENTVE|nr:unnamed protein product [Enterobius vermicularis]